MLSILLVTSDTAFERVSGYVAVWEREESNGCLWEVYLSENTLTSVKRT
jgi:hypothetical protein